MNEFGNRLTAVLSIYNSSPTIQLFDKLVVRHFWLRSAPLTTGWLEHALKVPRALQTMCYKPRNTALFQAPLTQSVTLGCSLFMSFSFLLNPPIEFFELFQHKSKLAFGASSVHSPAPETGLQ